MAVPTPVRQRLALTVNRISQGRNASHLAVTVTDHTTGKAITYKRRYANLFRTCEPFMQGDQLFLLIAPTVGSLAVIDFSSGQVVASFTMNDSFCPLDLYVPDPADADPKDTNAANADDWAYGSFGFVAGFAWDTARPPTIRWVDLSGILNRQLLVDTRLGAELELPPEFSLHQTVHLGTNGRIRFLTQRTITVK